MDLPFSLTGRCLHPAIRREPGAGNPIRFVESRPVRSERWIGAHVLAIQTAERPRGSLLGQLLISLDQAGLDRWEGPKLIVSDGCSPIVGGSWLLDASPPPPGGTSRTFMRVLRAAALAAPTFTRLTCLQDDVVLAKNFLDYVDQVLMEDDLGFISWYSSWDAKPRPGNSPRPVLEIGCNACFGGSQALTLPRRTADILLDFLESGRWPYRNACDRLFAAAMEGGRFAAHYPVIAQHIGDANSSLGHRERRSREFVGEDFDVLALVPGASPDEARGLVRVIP